MVPIFHKKLCEFHHGCSVLEPSGGLCGANVCIGLFFFSRNNHFHIIAVTLLFSLQTYF